MTLPYLPGFWDEISKNATAFAGQLPQIIQPDSVANKRLQEMIQQNPMLLSQIENMTPEARMAMEQTLGFKKQTPLRGLPEGAQLRAQREEQQAIASLTPDQRAERMANIAKTRTQTQITRETEQFDFTKKLNDLNFEKLSDDVEIGKMLNVEKKRALDVLNKARKDNPDIDFRGIIRGLSTGTLNDNLIGQLQVISGDPALSGALGTIVDFAKIQEQGRFSISARAATTQDDYIRLALNAVESARKEYNDASQSLTRLLNGAALSRINIEQARKTDPTRAALIDEAMARMNAAQTRLETYQPIVDKSFGIKAQTPGAGTPTPQATPQVGPLQPQQGGPFNLFGGMPAGGPAAPAAPAAAQAIDAEAQMALNAIRMRPDQETQIRAKYKQRTGKDLP